MYLKDENKSKEKIAALREDFCMNRVSFDIMPADVLAELLDLAIERIDYRENGEGKYENIVEPDERDAKDRRCAEKYIVDQLFAKIEEDIDLGAYNLE